MAARYQEQDKMKKTTLKNATDLQPGDVWRTVFPPVPRMYAPGEQSDPPIEQRYVVLRRKPGDTTFVFARLDVDLPSGPVLVRQFAADDSIDVEAPDLTPAQQHAERLAEYAEEYLLMVERGQKLGATLTEDHYAELRDLVAEVRPPEPPTLVEALASLDALTPHANGDPEVAIAIRLLDRARRSGVLK